MIFNATPLEGAFLIDVERHQDERGFLARTFCEQEFAEHGPTGFKGAERSFARAAGQLLRWRDGPGIAVHWSAPTRTTSGVGCRHSRPRSATRPGRGVVRSG